MSSSPRRRLVEVETSASLAELLKTTTDLSGLVINGVRLDEFASTLLSCELSGCVLIGCAAPQELLAYAAWSGAVVFPALSERPFQPYRKTLYSPTDLYETFDNSEPSSYSNTLDARIYQHWLDTGGPRPLDLVESLARRIHDHSITDSIEDFIEGQQVVAIMGGHGLARNDAGYASVARISRALARSGRLLASGGGPGAMEATHLGPWMSAHEDEALDEAIALLSVAPGFDPPGEWLAAAFEVRQRFPMISNESQSLGIPTWLYGHEPPNAFATHIAKYFANAVREDGLLTIARHGIVFTPGSAGTVQEVFQDATQNHYETAGPPSPMIFFGTRFWTETLPVVNLLRQLGDGKRWLDHVAITDDEAEVVELLTSHQRTDT